VGDGEKLLTYLNSALKALLGFDIFPRVPKKKVKILLPSVSGTLYVRCRSLLPHFPVTSTLHYCYRVNLTSPTHTLTTCWYIR